jgi:hypothetical protein
MEHHKSPPTALLLANTSTSGSPPFPGAPGHPIGSLWPIRAYLLVVHQSSPVNLLLHAVEMTFQRMTDYCPLTLTPGATAARNSEAWSLPLRPSSPPVSNLKKHTLLARRVQRAGPCNSQTRSAYSQFSKSTALDAKLEDQVFSRHPGNSSAVSAKSRSAQAFDLRSSCLYRYPVKASVGQRVSPLHSRNQSLVEVKPR